MKPTKRIMCPDCGKQKMLFESERKANDFIKWNGDDIGGTEKLRAYYCPSCCGWHITHKRKWDGYDRNTENLIEAFNRVKKRNSKLDRLIRGEVVRKKQKTDYTVLAAQLMDEIPDSIKNHGSMAMLRCYLTEYFANKGMKDDGQLRCEVYKLFWKNMYEQYNNERK